MGRFKTTFIILSLLLISGVIFFQNCAKAKFSEPNEAEVAGNYIQRFCRDGQTVSCSDETGTGIRCNEARPGVSNMCVYESCKPGYQMVSSQCTPVVCNSGEIANCSVTNGEGRKTCNTNNLGYSLCAATSCHLGFELQDGQCVPKTAACIADSSRDCSTESTYGSETCASDGSGYASCVFTTCKPGYNMDSNNTCVANVCDPNTITACTDGAASGFKTCNSAGNAWGSCEINSCQSGYTLKDGVCVVQTCTPGSTAACDFDNGSGEKVCTTDGLDYGSCQLLACDTGFALEQGQCVQTKCTPASAQTCQEEGGSGTMYCYQNGLAFGPCTIDKCDEGFEMKNGICKRPSVCTPGEVLTCTGTNGSGQRTCHANGMEIGPCELTSCDTGYVLKNEGGKAVCTPESRGGGKK